MPQQPKSRPLNSSEPKPPRVTEQKASTVGTRQQNLPNQQTPPMTQAPVQTQAPQTRVEYQTEQRNSNVAPRSKSRPAKPKSREEIRYERRSSTEHIRQSTEPDGTGTVIRDSSVRWEPERRFAEERIEVIQKHSAALRTRGMSKDEAREYRQDQFKKLRAELISKGVDAKDAIHIVNDIIHKK